MTKRGTVDKETAAAFDFEINSALDRLQEQGHSKFRLMADIESMTDLEALRYLRGMLYGKENLIDGLYLKPKIKHAKKR